MIKAVLFDYDGTFMNTRDSVLGLWKIFLEKEGNMVLSDDEMSEIFRLPIEASFAKYFPDHTLEEIMDVYKDYQKKYLIPREPFDGMVDLVKNCYDQGYKIGLVTSRQGVSARKGLTNSGVIDMFSSLVTSETCENHKPSKDPIMACVNELGVSTDETVMVGDSLSDLESGKSAGVPIILVGWTEDLDKDNPPDHCPPYAVCETSEEIFDTIQQM